MRAELLPAGADLAELERLRYAVYVEEQHKPLPQADHVERRLGDPLDTTAQHFVLLAGGALVGCGRLHAGNVPAHIVERVGPPCPVPPGQVGYVSKVMLLPAARRSSAAGALLGTMLDWGLRRGLQLALCHCAPPLVPLYRRLGLRPTGQVWFDPHVGEQHGLYLTREDAARLPRLRPRATAG